MKLLHNKVVKSSQPVNYNGYVKINNQIELNSFDRYIRAGSDGEQADSLQMQMKILDERQRALEIDYKQKLAELEDKQQDIINKAQQQASGIISSARAEAEGIKIEAYRVGFTEGKVDARAELENAIETFKQLIDSLNKHKDALYIQNEKQIYDLIYEVVEKITNSKLQSNKDVIFNIVKQASKAFRNSDYVKISLASCDISTEVITDKDFINQICSGILDVEIELLKDAKSGTVILDNNSVIIDASVETQLDFIKEVLKAGKENI